MKGARINLIEALAKTEPESWSHAEVNENGGASDTKDGAHGMGDHEDIRIGRFRNLPEPAEHRPVIPGQKNRGADGESADPVGKRIGRLRKDRPNGHIVTAVGEARGKMVNGEVHPKTDQHPLREEGEA